MKKLLMGAVVVVMAATANVPIAAAGQYGAIAVGVGGWAYREGSTMEGARMAARRACQNLGFGSCSTTTAERSWWYFAAGWCNGMSVPYSSASKHGWGAANQLLHDKGSRDGYYDCVVQANR